MRVSTKRYSVKKKNVAKNLRTVLEVLIILFAIWLVVQALFLQPKYVPVKADEAAPLDSGFIVLSYFGVDRGENNESLINTTRLQEHLDALHNSGYVTVSQQDILDYYEKAKPLPERSLFLMFEDGRRDTTIFAQPILEEYNYRATALTYAQNLIQDDPKFMAAKDLVELGDTTYWELGSNGYRLAYINVFDRHGNFLDTMNSVRYQMMSPYLDARYDHFLMDYIRDGYGVPKETPAMLTERIDGEYERMRDIYSEGLGFVPGAYILMHSNSPYYGTNENAGTLNAKWIPSLFRMNFNYEGNPLNTENGNVYGLTRMQPGPYWYTNHLLMRVRSATGQELEFVTGDENRAKHWTTVEGAAEYKAEDIVLTTVPGGSGRLRLDESIPSSFRATMALNGNKAGGQTVYLRADEELQSYITVGVVDNRLLIRENSVDEEDAAILADIDLDELDGLVPQSWEENRREAEARKHETDARYAASSEEAQDAATAMLERQNAYAATVAEGAEEYSPVIGRRELAHRELEIELEVGSLSVFVDGKPAVEKLPVNVTEGGDLLLEAEETGQSRDDNNAVDTVYDGVFSSLVISDLSDEEIIFFDNTLHGWELFKRTAEDIWDRVVNWFINTL